VNARDEQGNTPLHVAADPKSCSANLVKKLLNCGAHLDEKNDEGETFDSISKEKVRCFVDPMPFITLKCLAATAVSELGLLNNIKSSEVPEELKSFVRNH